MSDKENKDIEKEEAVDQINEETIEETVDPLTQAQDQIAIEKDKFLRLFAEFENYKKRTSRERVELFKTAGQEIMQAMLPVLDDFDRALTQLHKEEEGPAVEGVSLIRKKLSTTLESKGLSTLDVKAGDVFDSEIHDAITQIPAPSKKMKDKIVDVIEKGYKLGDKIIRHPKVIVGK